MASNDSNKQAGGDSQAARQPQQNDTANQTGGNSIESSRLTPGAAASDTGGSERQERIAKAAYSRAEQRGFAPGADWDDWFDAEREVDREIEQLTTKSNLPED